MGLNWKTNLSTTFVKANTRVATDEEVASYFTEFSTKQAH